MRILFMGTPEIAAYCLQQLIQAGHEICGVFTQADKPVGRKQVLTAPPVKKVAEQHGIAVFQPKTLKDGIAEQQIAQLKPDLCVVVAYGKLLPSSILQLPTKGCINLHVSLLPKYRGSAPVQWAILNGEKETGVSIMYLDEGMDTGDILDTQPISIGENETSGELFEKVTQQGSTLLLQTIEKIAQGTAVATPQDHTKATLAPMLKKEMAEFTFAQPAHNLHNLVRGMNPWPVAYFLYEQKKVKVTRSLLQKQQGKTGEILSINPLVVACQQDAILLEEVVPEGKKAMSGSAWAMGRRFQIGDFLR